MTAPQTRTKRLAGVVGLALTAVIGIGSIAGANAARDDLTPKAYEALVDQGLGNVKVDFDGREATLSNGSPEELARAEKIVEAIPGVRWADVDSDRTNLPEPPTFSITRLADGVNLSGVVPNAQVAKQLEAAAADSFGTVTGYVTVDRRVGTADWLTTMPKLIPNVADVDGLTLSVDGDSLAIGGSVDSQADIETVTGLIEPTLGSLTLDNTLKIATSARSGVAGVLGSKDVTALRAATVYFARGSSTLDARSRTGLDVIADLLRRNSGVELEIGGHAGPDDPARGKVLSDQRVTAVKDYLVAAGIDAARLSTRSYGSDPGTSGDAFAEQYRRVDFIVKGN